MPSPKTSSSGTSSPAESVAPGNIRPNECTREDPGRRDVRCFQVLVNAARYARVCW